LKYSTYIMGVALTFDVIVDLVLLVVGLAVRTGALVYDAYLMTGYTFILLIGMGASLGLTVGGLRRSMLAVSLVFNMAMAALLTFSWLKSSVDVVALSSGLVMAVVNIILTLIAYANFGSPRNVPLPLIGI